MRSGEAGRVEEDAARALTKEGSAAAAGPLHRNAALDSRIDLESEYWLSLARHRPLGILSDLDGTLLPFANTPDAARPTPEIRSLVHDLASLRDVGLAIVSGRSREVLDGLFPRP